MSVSEAARTMSAAGTNLHNKRQPTEKDRAPRVPDMDATQQHKLRERQRFFEEVFQHDVDVYLPSTFLHIDYKRPPLGSVSSMEVNVDMLEQMDLLDLSDPEALDVFFSPSGEEEMPSPSVLVGTDIRDGVCLHAPDGCEAKSRMSSTSSNYSSNSQDINEDGLETPVQSDDEGDHGDSLLLVGTPTTEEEEKDKSGLSTLTAT